jgi:putative glutamine amidotransferase
MAQPVIGLTLDSEPPGGYSKTHYWYALRENYATAVTRAGGLPILLPHEPDQAEGYLSLIDGLVITGGAFDVDPALFGAGSRHASVKTKDRRTAFELAVTQGAVAADKPVLGICGGQQLINVALGGTLIQHIPDEVPDALPHEQPNPRFVVDATAPDGVIEGIEDPRRRFLIGVQWHPEYAISDGDTRLFAAFIAAAQR